MKILNLGSINMDLVYRVGRFARPGETISSSSLRRFAGGKGANQSVALARAGAKVFHAGRIGKDGEWLKEKLAESGVDVGLVRTGEGPSGHAVIQVDDSGQNSIVLFPGENRNITPQEVEEALDHFGRGDIILLQNETSSIPAAIEGAAARGAAIAFNPAPFGPEVAGYPLDRVGTFILNETEAAGLADGGDGVPPKDAARALAERFPQAEIVLTLGAKGVLYRRGKEEVRVPAVRVKAVDTTAAGDAFIGYFLAGRAEGRPVEECLRRACAAAAISVKRRGAMDSIPKRAEVDSFRPPD